MHVEPLPDGDLLAITKDHSLSRHRWDSSLVWRSEMRAHHDLAVRDDVLLTLVRDRRETRVDQQSIPVLSDGIAEVSAESGEVARTVDLLSLFRPHVPTSRLRRIATRVNQGETAGLLRGGGLGDVLHVNSIEILDHDIEGIAPAGSILLSLRTISRIAIVDRELEDLLWIWGRGELSHQHDATQLANGNVLLFNNGITQGRSEVLEVDPVAGDVVGRMGSQALYSRLRGGAQRLANGNTLITESDRGHAVEVTSSGETVWEFWNPDVRHPNDHPERAVIYRLNRFPRVFFRPLRR